MVKDHPQQVNMNQYRLAIYWQYAGLNSNLLLLMGVLSIRDALIEYN